MKERVESVAYFMTPILLAVLYISVLYILLPYGTFLALLSVMGGYFFPPLGKESVIPLAVTWGIDPYITAVSVATVDIILAAFVFFNFPLIGHIPYIGPRLINMAERARKRMGGRLGTEVGGSIAIALFVMVPFEGSGGLVASIMAVFLGMDRLKAFLAISTGALAGTMLIALFARTLLSIFSPDIRAAAGVIVALAFLVTLYRVLKGQKG